MLGYADQANMGDVDFGGDMGAGAGEFDLSFVNQEMGLGSAAPQVC